MMMAWSLSPTYFAAKRKLQTCVPRVQLERNEQIIKNAISKESVPKIIWSPVRIRIENSTLDDNAAGSNAEICGDIDDNSTVFVDCNSDIRNYNDTTITGLQSYVREPNETFEETHIETKLEFPFPHPISCFGPEVTSQTRPLIIESVVSMAASSSSPVQDLETVELDTSSSTTESDGHECTDRNSDICDSSEHKIPEKETDRTQANVRLALVAQKYLQKYRNVKRPKYKQYSNKAFTSALKAVQKGMRRHTAARKYNIPSRTLYQRVDKNGIALPYKRAFKYLTVPEPTISDTDSDSDNSSIIIEEVHTKKRNPRYKKYTKSEMLAALREVEEGRLSALKAARKFRIPPRTIYEKLKRLKINPTRKYLNPRAQPQKLNKVQQNNVDSDKSSSDIEYERPKKSKRLVFSDSSSDTEIEDREIVKSSDGEKSNSEDEQVNRRKRKRRKHKQYTIDDMRLAIKAVQEGMGYLAAAKKFGVPDRTLRDKIKKLG